MADKIHVRVYLCVMTLCGHYSNDGGSKDLCKLSDSAVTLGPDMD